MQFPTLTAAALIPLLGIASAGCYTSGATWPSDHAAVVSALQTVSDHFANAGSLSTGEHVYDINAGGKCIHFVLDNISGTTRYISSNEALDGFTKEYTGCDHGGDTSYTNWRYMYVFQQFGETFLGCA